MVLRGFGNCRGRVCVTTPDGDGVPSRVFSSPDDILSVSPGKETTVRLYVRFGRVHGWMTVQFLVHDRPVAEETFQASPDGGPKSFPPAIESRPLVVCLGDAAKTAEEAAALGGLDPQQRPVVARIDRLDGLPDQWYGYEGVDALVLTAAGRRFTSDFSPAQSDALDRWVRMGGRLVLCVGGHAEEVLGKGGVLTRFAPGRLQSVVPLRQTSGLESYAGGSVAVPLAAGQSLRTPQLTNVEGVVEAREADLPLAVRQGRGFGQVMFLAADLDQPPLDRWNDAPQLLAKLLDWPVGRSAQAEEASGGITFGYTDIAGQLRSSLDQFDGVRLTPFWIVAALAVAYLLLIGPGDYFFLRKIVGRMAWTWFTFPAAVLIVGATAYLLAHRLKGDAFRVNQVDLVDVDAASGSVRGTSWMNVFSPRTQTFDFSVKPWIPSDMTPSGSAAPMAWLGLPGRGLGGMDPQTSDPVAWSGQYDFATGLTAMRGVPIPTWSTRSLTARWSQSAASPGVQAELADEEQVLAGTIANHLKFPLSHCILAYDRWAYELETLAPGQSVEIGMMSQRSELRTRWTGCRLVGRRSDQSYREEFAVYDQSSSDPLYVLRMMMFYEAAGGRRYTGLTNDYQRFVDFSDLLKTGRAVLMAQAPDAGAELLRDGQTAGAGPRDRHAVFVRFALPVKKKPQ